MRRGHWSYQSKKGERSFTGAKSSYIQTTEFEFDRYVILLVQNIPKRRICFRSYSKYVYIIICLYWGGASVMGWFKVLLGGGK